MRPAAGAPDVAFLTGDTAVVVSYSMVTHRVDTLARLATGRGFMVRGSSTGFKTDPPSPAVVEFTVGDAWALMTDGSIAIVRGRDYRIEWINGDGTRASSPRIAHDWVHFSDADKASKSDSINRVIAQNDSSIVSAWRVDSTAFANGKADSIRAERSKTIVPALQAAGASAQMIDQMVRIPNHAASAARAQCARAARGHPGLSPTDGSNPGASPWRCGQQCLGTIATGGAPGRRHRV